MAGRLLPLDFFAGFCLGCPPPLGLLGITWHGAKLLMMVLTNNIEIVNETKSNIILLCMFSEQRFIHNLHHWGIARFCEL